MNFDRAFKLLIGHEGGYQNKWTDRGNWTSGKVGIGKRKGTKFGITAMTYPYLDIKNITLFDAKKIYERDFWVKLYLNHPDMPAIMRFQLFDAAVNSSVHTSSRFLQKAVGAKADGKIGPNTMAHVEQFKETYGEGIMLAGFNGHRLEFMTNIPIWKQWGRGWARRIAANLKMLDK